MFTNIIDFHFHMAVVPRVSSALAAVGLRQLPPPMIIGERLNTQGSRKAKQMVLDGDYDGLVNLGRSQAEEGAHCIDVCVATTEKSDELEFMVNLVKRLSLEVEAPLVIDSTDPDVIRAAIRQVPGRPIINSINLEGDGSRFASLAPVMAEYGTPAIALCIGPGGMAKTAKEKLETARLLFDEGRKYGLAPEQYIFDVLTFTLATGQDEFRAAGVETLEGIKLVKKEFPDSFTALGLSNISFGLTPPARRILNSVFLYHAIRAGLDAAIVNAREIIPYGEIDKKESGLAENLIFDRGPDALSKFVSYFEDGGGAGSGGVRKRRGPEIDASWPPAKRANFRIVNRLADGIAQDVVHAIAMQAGLESSVIPDKGRDGGDADAVTIDAPRPKTHDAAIHVLNESLLPAMKEVGDRFGAGELILPFVLKSAECMKAAVGELERYLVKEEGGASKGKLVLGTVYGDVHDIGKNLVKTIFQNNGYAVYDLGKQVPLQKFLDKIAEVRPDAVGLSALLVSTSRQMQLFVEHARENKMDTPVLCGGAAINSSYINRIATTDGDKKDALYEPGVFYCNTMFDGLRIMDALVDGARREEMLSDWRHGLSRWQARQESLSKAKAAGTGPDGEPGGAAAGEEGKPKRSAVEPVRPPAIPSSMRPGVPARLQPGDIPMGDVWPLVDTKSLYRLSWGVRGRGAGRESQEDHERLFLSWQRRIASERMFEPRVVYGYFRCHNRGGAVLDVEDAKGGVVSFAFPRSQKAERLCLADYFGRDDVVALQSVTVGSRVTDTIEEWNRKGMYTDAYYLHGLAVEAAEALAEWTNRRIRSELNLDGGCLRYSWGYPSCPDLAQHALVWRLLEPQHSDMTLTESGQIVPEHSTAAIVVHHPGSKYFVL